eukprot:g19118.t1
MYQCWPPNGSVLAQDSVQQEEYKRRIKVMTEEKKARFIDYDCNTGAREHPDPFGYQLKTIVGAWHYWQEVDPEVYRDDNTYFFIDYMSLPQFKRSAEEQTCFQCAMRHMHLFYANSGAIFCKSVWRLEKLTPPGVKRLQILRGRTIPVYILAEGKVVEVSLKRLKRSIGGKCSSSCDDNCRNLHANDIVYLGRGWCRAEYEWAKPYTINISRRGVCLRCCWAQYDALFHRLSLPWTPEAFQRSVAAHALKFTHRGDIDPVLELQRTVFQQKVVTLENFLCTWLPCHEVDDLVELVGLLTAVQSFALTAAHVAESQQVALATALETRPALQTVKIFSVQLSPGAVQVLTAAPQLRTLELNACGLGDAGAGAVATALAQHPTLREVNLLFNAIGSHGATALAKALVTNDVLELLDLAGNKIRSRGAVALAEALRSNGSVKRLGIGGNPLDAQGVRALRSVAERIEAFQRSVATRALKFTHRGDIDPVLELQRTVFQQKVATLENFECTWLPCHEVEDLVELVGLLQAVQNFQLVAAHVADSQQMALATALGTRQTLQTVAINCIQLSPGAAQVLAAVPRLHTLGLIDCGLGDAGAGAVANALAQHPTLREVQLQINAIGSRGATALAKALVTNNVLEKLNLQYNKIRSRGAVALAEALRSNDTLRCLMFRFNPIGAQGVRALRRIAERIAVAHEGSVRRPWTAIRGIGSLAGGLAPQRSRSDHHPNESLRHSSGDRASERQEDGKNGGAFQRNVSTNTLKFTHRSDIKPVIELQRKVFDQKVATLEKFECNWLPCHEVEDLLELLPLLGAVQEFWLTEAYVPHSQQLPLANALARRPALQKVLINSVRLEPPVVQVLADVPQLRTLRLFACGLGDAGAGAVAAGLTQHAALQEVWLECNGIGDLGAEALAKALESNHVLELLDLQLNHIRSSGAIALAEALRLRNEAMRRLVMRYNPMDAQGVQALRRAVAEKESLDVDHEGLERNAESSYCGWMFCVLLRVFVWIVPRATAVARTRVPFAHKKHQDVLRGGHSTVWGSYFDATSRRWGYACCRSLDRNEACPQNEPQAVDKAESSEEEDAAAQAQLIAWQDGQLLDARHTPEQPPVLGRQTPEDFLAHFVLYWFHHWTEHENPPKAQRQTTHEALLQLMQRLKRKALDRSLLQHLTQYADLAQRREYAQAGHGNWCARFALRGATRRTMQRQVVEKDVKNASAFDTDPLVRSFVHALKRRRADPSKQGHVPAPKAKADEVGLPVRPNIRDSDGRGHSPEFVDVNDTSARDAQRGIAFGSREDARSLPFIARMLSLSDVQRRLVPAFEKLTKDPHWGVKKATAENLVQFAMTMPASHRRESFEQMVNSLLNDTSRFVSCAMLQQLGYFIGCLEELGASEWPALKAAFSALCGDAQAKTRKAMAASCHVVAQSLGPDLVEQEATVSGMTVQLGRGDGFVQRRRIEHFAAQYWNASLRQRERLDALTEAVHRTAAGLRALGINAFLESAGLIGWLRHHRSQLPWDSDRIAALGASNRSPLRPKPVDWADRSNGAQDAVRSCQDFARSLGDDFSVLKFACACEEDCEGDNRRMAGRVAHKKTGVCIDIFVYAPERFVEQAIMIPANPREFLSWEYGRCLGAHVWPWRLLLYTDPSEALHLILTAKGAMLLLGTSGLNILPGFLLLGCTTAATLLLRKGLLLLSVLLLSLCESLALLLRPDWCSLRRMHLALVVVLWAVGLQALQGCIDQLWCQVDDFYFSPRRPKSWTFIRPVVQRRILQALTGGMAKVKNWRCRQLAAQQLGTEIAWRSLVPFFLQLCSDGVAQLSSLAFFFTIRPLLLRGGWLMALCDGERLLQRQSGQCGLAPF